VDARDIISDIPADAFVSPHSRIVPQISRREEVYYFPTPFVLYRPDESPEGTRLPQADEVDYVVIAVDTDDADQARGDAVSTEFELVRANDHGELYRRIPPGSSWRRLCRP